VSTSILPFSREARREEEEIDKVIAANLVEENQKEDELHKEVEVDNVISLEGQ